MLHILVPATTMTAERFLLIVASILMNTRKSSASSLWIDPATPSYAQTAIGMDNRELSLVFSDEFDDDGRAFHDGSDTRWTAEDRPATVNGALNYYNSSRVRTRSGNLVIETMREDAAWIEHDEDGNEFPITRNYQSGMLTSWNKFCFTSGMVEISFQFPGRPDKGGLWPAFWMLGNLARPNYLASTDGIWPWSYDECGLSPEAQDALQGQMMNACNNPRGRGSPEIDIIEEQPGDFILEYFNVPLASGSLANISVGRPLMASSLQVAPGISPLLRPEIPAFPVVGEWYPDLFPFGGPAYGVGDNNRMLNNYWYGQQIVTEPEVWQDGLSVNWQHSESFYEQQTILRMEWQTGKDDGYVRWYNDENDLIFEVTAEMLKSKPGAPDAIAEIPYEAMYMILNTDISTRWGWNGCDETDPCSLANPGLCSNGMLSCTDCRNPDCLVCPHITAWFEAFCDAISPENPAEYKIDYIRIYQDTSDETHTVGCDPPDLPTRDYINENWKKYTFDPFVNKQPLLEVQHGGGKCIDSLDCGLAVSVRGLCKEGICECLSGWTGPNCQAPCIGQFANCNGDSGESSSTSSFDIKSLGFFLVLLVPIILILLSCLVGFFYCSGQREKNPTTTTDERAIASLEMPKPSPWRQFLSQTIDRAADDDLSTRTCIDISSRAV